MSLIAYDDGYEKVDKTKTWILSRTRQLLSREIKYRPYICLLKRYDSSSGINNFYLALLDNKDNTKTCKRTFVDNYGRLKINVSSVLAERGINTTKDFNISIDVVESTNEYDVYYLSI